VALLTARIDDRSSWQRVRGVGMEGGPTKPPSQTPVTTCHTK
ncbi:uncharacterized protein METZ01_LOCUS511117, partial [marine metagenome]